MLMQKEGGWLNAAMPQRAEAHNQTADNAATDINERSVRPPSDAHAHYLPGYTSGGMASGPGLQWKRSGTWARS